MDIYGGMDKCVTLWYNIYMKDPNIITVNVDVSTLEKIPADVKREIFMALQKDTISKVAVDFGFEKRYSSGQGARSAVYGIYKQIKNKPEVFGITPATLEATIYAVEHRKTSLGTIEAKVDENERINFIKDELGGIRDKTAKIISMKLDRAMKFKRDREKISLKELAGVLVNNLDQIEVKCLPKDMIHDIEVNIESLVDFTNSIHVGDLNVPSKITVLTPADQLVVSVIAPRVEVEAPVEAVAAPAEGAAAPAEGEKKE